MKTLIAALFLVAALAGGAHATPPTVIASTNAPNAFDVVPASMTFVASDNVNGNAFAHTGKELLIVQNTDASAQTITVTSVPDASGRTGDSTKVINPNAFYVFQLFPTTGWRQTDGTIHLTTSNANLKLCVIRLP